MRPRIEALDVDAMEWTPLGPAGLFSKLLSRDEETGARTALQRLVPGEGGYQPPTIAHFHTTYEEILGVHGLFSFDSRTWIRPGSYVFHPPRTVHGFKSNVPEESWFLSRVGRNLDVNLVEAPRESDLYVIEGDVPPRVPVAQGDPWTTKPHESRPFLGGDVLVDWCLLSSDPASGEGSALVKLPAGWRSSVATLGHYLEMFVVEGQVGVAGSAAGEGNRRTYFFYPPETAISPLEARAESLVYVNFGTAPAA